MRLSDLHFPHVLSIWGSDVYIFPFKSILHKHMLIGNVQAATAVASTSSKMAEQLKKIYECKKRIFITPFGVNTEQFSPSVNPNSSEKFIVGIVKLIETVYGIEYLISGFSIFAKRLEEEQNPLFDTIELDNYGKGSDEERLRQVAAKSAYQNKIKFMGFLPNEQVADVIKNFSISCLPSLSESFGVSAVEAMACGVPVIASNVDGFAETVEDGVTGFLVPKQDSQAIADKLYDLVTNSDLCRKFGEAGRQRVLDLYDFEKNVQTMEQVYHQTIQIYKETN
jgi:glycosyltransferase involved in cell wall biosynthesis